MANIVRPSAPQHQLEQTDSSPATVWKGALDSFKGLDAEESEECADDGPQSRALMGETVSKNPFSSARAKVVSEVHFPVGRSILLTLEGSWRNKAPENARLALAREK